MCLCFFRKLWSPFDIASRCWCFFVEFPCSLFSFQDVNDCGYFSWGYYLSFVYICVSVSFFGLNWTPVSLLGIVQDWPFLQFNLVETCLCLDNTDCVLIFGNAKKTSICWELLHSVDVQIYIWYILDLSFSCREWSTALHLGFDEIALSHHQIQ